MYSSRTVANSQRQRPFVVDVDVDCGLYSDGTDVQFPNFDLLPGTHAMGSYGSLACWAYLDTGTGTSEDAFYLLAIRGPTRGEGKRGIEPGSSDPKSSPLPLRHRGGQRPFVKINIILTDRSSIDIVRPLHN